MTEAGWYDSAFYDQALYADESALTFELDCDFDRDGVYEEALTTRVIVSMTWKIGMDDSWQEVATPGELVVILDNGDNELSPDNASADYRTKLVPGCLMRLRAFYQGTTQTLYIGRLHHLSVQPGLASFTDAHRVTLHIADPIAELIAGDYNPPLLTSVRVDEALAQVFADALIPWPYDQTFWVWDAARWDQTTRFFENTLIDFEQARTVLPFSGVGADAGTKTRGTQPFGFISDLVAAEAGGRFWWDARTAKFRFHNRYHDPLNSASAAVPSSITSVDPDDIHYGDDVANVVTVNYVPTEIGTPASILFSADNLPYRLSAGQKLQTTMRYRDPDNPSARVAGKDVITPAIGTDIIANAASDGSGVDQTSAVGYSFEIGATSTAMTLTNTSKQDIYITTQQVRGTPLKTYNAEAATAMNATSIARYNRRSKPPRQVSALGDTAFANAYAQKLVGQFADAYTRIGAVTLTAIESADILLALTLTVGDPVTLADPFSGHTKDYIIVGEQHTANAADSAHTVRWTLKPRRPEGMFIWDQSKWAIDTIWAF